MKRSEINDAIAAANEMFSRHGFALPPFACWSPAEFRKRTDGSRIVTARMGWDVTDFGLDDFAQTGLVLFTLRNGSLDDLRAGRGMAYAEKLLVVRQGQLTPTHTHVVKAEDIINRGGATLAIELFGSDAEGGCDARAGGTVLRDGVPTDYGPGEVLRLAPGASVTLRPGDWHAFWGEGGDVLVGEVSTVNDDETDNLFRDPVGRFTDVEEDAPPTHLLVSDYDTWLDRP